MTQAGLGQLKLSNRAKPISEMLAREETPPRVKRLLSLVSEVKAFGERKGLKATPNYADYVQWDDSAVTWIVSASRPYRFEPKVWSFPIVGSFTYVGWFSRTRAHEFAAEIAKEGWETDVRGAPAYSTLGWFRDPVISTMFREGPGELGDFAHLILHESVHATLYIENQSSLNESMAEFVADKLAPVFLKERFGESSPELIEFEREQKKSKSHGERLSLAYHELEKLYASQLSDAEKQVEKAKVFEKLKTDLGSKRERNNASLIQFRTYGVGYKAFELLWSKVNGDLKLFLSEIEKLKKSKSPPQRDDLDDWLIAELSL